MSIAYGGDYNPDQWPEEIWPEDVALMKEAGVSLVSLGIFSWANVQPGPEQWEFGWLDRVMDLLGEGGIGVSLATMTASPPAWLTHRHPEILPVDADGRRMWPGGRQHYCPSSPVLREHSVRLAERVARRYVGHPALALWHVGNEYGNVTACYCDVSASAFRTWLRDRYGSVEELNLAWSTAFWSQRYGTWDEVLPPRHAAPFRNSAQVVDYARFHSAELLACYRAERDVLRTVTPDVPVTTNMPPSLARIDLAEWAPYLDVLAYDSYPDPADPDAAARAGFHYDLMRSAGGGRPWLLMEQAPSAVNWRRVNPVKPAGVMRLWSWQAVAYGADAVMFFQWRQSLGGAEKFHSAMVPHGGTATRTFREVRELGRELAGLPELAGGVQPPAPVALVVDGAASRWALEQDSHPSGDLRLMDAVWAHYLPLDELGFAVDVVSPDADLGPYAVVVVPNLYSVSAEAAAGLEAFVAGGGALLMSFFSGIVDPCDRVWSGGYPAPFRSLLGLTVEEFAPLVRGAEVSLEGELGAGTATLWSESIRLEGAEPVMRFAPAPRLDAARGPGPSPDSGLGALGGWPAVTRHRFGSGTAWYVATRPDATTMNALTRQVCARVSPVLRGLPPGVRARTRVAAEGAVYHVVLNHTAEPVRVDLPEPLPDLLTRSAPARELRLDPYGVAVLGPVTGSAAP